MLATTIIDPLLSSPTQVQRHDNDMAMTFPSSFQTPQLMDSLTYSASYSSEQNDDDDEAQQQQQQYMASLTYSTSVSSNHSSFEQQEDDDEDETPFEQLMNRGNYLRQLRALALHDEMERRASALLGEEEKNKEDQGDDDDDTFESGNTRYCSEKMCH
jgi:cysteinyl-tRNA synthetase